MKRIYIIKNSIAHYFLQLIQIILIFIAILGACGEYQGTNELQINVLIKLTMITSIVLLVLIDKIRIKEKYIIKGGK